MVRTNSGQPVRVVGRSISRRYVVERPGKGGCRGGNSATLFARTSDTLVSGRGTTLRWQQKMEADGHRKRKAKVDQSFANMDYEVEVEKVIYINGTKYRLDVYAKSDTEEVAVEIGTTDIEKRKRLRKAYVFCGGRSVKAGMWKAFWRCGRNCLRRNTGLELMRLTDCSALLY